MCIREPGGGEAKSPGRHKFQMLAVIETHMYMYQKIVNRTKKIEIQKCNVNLK